MLLVPRFRGSGIAQFSQNEQRRSPRRIWIEPFFSSHTWFTATNVQRKSRVLKNILTFIPVDIYHCHVFDWIIETARFPNRQNKASSKRLSKKMSPRPYHLSSERQPAWKTNAKLINYFYFTKTKKCYDPSWSRMITKGTWTSRIAKCYAYTRTEIIVLKNIMWHFSGFIKKAGS